jgi:hypothetical protein
MNAVEKHDVTVSTAELEYVKGARISPPKLFNPFHTTGSVTYYESVSNFRDSKA